MVVLGPDAGPPERRFSATPVNDAEIGAGTDVGTVDGIAIGTTIGSIAFNFGARLGIPRVETGGDVEPVVRRRSPVSTAFEKNVLAVLARTADTTALDFVPSIDA
jgi:hypothetical protein